MSSPLNRPPDRPEGAADGWRPLRAMVLAAGLGLRMRPITDVLPKPLVSVAGRSLLDRVLDRLAEAGVEEAVVNIHHLADLIERHLAGRQIPRLHLSRETTLLETGGGIVQALPLLGDQAFYVVNADVLWGDGERKAVSQLAARWDDARMDALLLLQPLATAFGYEGQGDFHVDGEGRITRRRDAGPFANSAAYVFAGLQILHPRLLADPPAGAFSLNVLFDRAIGQRRLFGLVHDGIWLHIGTPDQLARAEARIAADYPELRCA